MTTDLERPGLKLLGSPLLELGIGRPGPAREAALVAAREDATNAHVHLLDATYAALCAGEPRASARLLGDCEASAPRDEAWQRRIDACRVLQWNLDRLWYPGEAAADIANADGKPDLTVGRPGDAETLEVETTADFQARVLYLRWLAESERRRGPEDALALFFAQARGANDQLLPLERLVYGDLLYRAGDTDEGSAVVAEARRRFESLGTDDALVRVLIAWSFVLEGDWYATPGSWPERLGIAFAYADPPSPVVTGRDLGRAARAYEQADAWLAGVDEPRARGALALRRSVLAWLAGDHEAQKALLQAAADDFVEAGDAARRWLTVVHALLADVALGRIATTRRSAGTSFDLQARGPIAALQRWGEQEGSVSWTTGLGRIFQGAAAWWQAQGDYPRAQLAYELAAPLLPASGAIAATAALRDLATLESDNGFAVRALTRRRAIVAMLPPITEARSDTLDWGNQIFTLLDVVNGQLFSRGTAAGIDVAELEWACRRLRALLALPGVPPAGSWDPTSQAKPQTPDEVVAAATEHVRVGVALGEAYASFKRATQAASIGATARAERWYDDAVDKLPKLGPEADVGARRRPGATASSRPRLAYTSCSIRPERVPGSSPAPPCVRTTTRRRWGSSGPKRTATAPGRISSITQRQRSAAERPNCPSP